MAVIHHGSERDLNISHWPSLGPQLNDESIGKTFDLYEYPLYSKHIIVRNYGTVAHYNLLR